MLFAVCACYAEDEASLVLESRITGNQEQPKVLYLVPWQAGAGSELLNLPLDSLSEAVFQPLNRDEFLRQLAFRKQLPPSGDQRLDASSIQQPSQH